MQRDFREKEIEKGKGKRRNEDGGKKAVEIDR